MKPNMPPRALFRVDAARRCGQGHLMRCMVLATKLQQRGWQCHFMTLEWPGDSSAGLLQGSGFLHHSIALAAQFLPMEAVASDATRPEKHALLTEFNHWNASQVLHLMNSPGGSCLSPDETTTLASATSTVALKFSENHTLLSSAPPHAQHTQWQLLVIDHYELDAQAERLLKQRWPYTTLMVIDDLANRPHQCDILLDQNLVPAFQQRYQPWVPPNCLQLLGPRYVLLRDEFYRVAVPPRDYFHKSCITANDANPASKAATQWRFLLFFGGADADNLTTRAMDALELLKFKHWHADIVIGSHHPARAQITKRCQDASCYTLHIQSSRMAELMASADLMIGAGGSTHWERAFLQLPAIVVRTAQNQTATTMMLTEQGVCIDAGDNTISASALATHINTVLMNPQGLQHMATASGRVFVAATNENSADAEFSGKIIGVDAVIMAITQQCQMSHHGMKL
jgi:UDP-2,4-diacetamido-2,4,6-trideoxy-beta-L-altropyranose hydrolase